MQVRSLGVGNGTPFPYSCLGNSMGRGAWRAIVHGATKSWTRLSDWTYTLPRLHESGGVRDTEWVLVEGKAGIQKKKKKARNSLSFPWAQDARATTSSLCRCLHPHMSCHVSSWGCSWLPAFLGSAVLIINPLLSWVPLLRLIMIPDAWHPLSYVIHV